MQKNNKRALMRYDETIVLKLFLEKKETIWQKKRDKKDVFYGMGRVREQEDTLRAKEEWIEENNNPYTEIIKYTNHPNVTNPSPKSHRKVSSKSYDMGKQQIKHQAVYLLLVKF